MLTYIRLDNNFSGITMPTVLRIDGYRFFFFSLEGSEPAHIHVEHGDKVAKYWVNPVCISQFNWFQKA